MSIIIGAPMTCLPTEELGQLRADLATAKQDLVNEQASHERTESDWRPSNADPVCDPKLAKRGTLEALAVALDGTWSKGQPGGGGSVKTALDAYRTECRPAPLRTRQEVDAEIVNVARIWSGSHRESDQRWLERLCSEPTADEPEVRPEPIRTIYTCPNCTCQKCAQHRYMESIRGGAR